MLQKDNENNSTLKHVREENSNLSQRIRQLVDVEKQNDVHQQEIAKQKENIAALNKVEHENRELQAMVEKLKTVSPGTQDITLVEKVETLEQEKDSMQHAISDWKSLAEKSFMEYKKMLPKYEKADEYRLDAMSKAQEIVNLKHELATAKTSQSKGSGSGADAAYWRSKYDNLLANYGN